MGSEQIVINNNNLIFKWMPHILIGSVDYIKHSLEIDNQTNNCLISSNSDEDFNLEQRISLSVSN